MIRTVIVDDVDLAREAIRIRLSEHKDFEIVGEAATHEEAIAIIRQLEPDLIFLDIQLHAGDGFQLLEAIGPSPARAVIFVTAHDEYAIRAYDSEPLHFLLKPIDEDHFEDALRRARRHICREKAQGKAHAVRSFNYKEAFPASGVAPNKARYWSRLVIRERDRFLLLKVTEVSWIASAANYSELHSSNGGSYIIRFLIGDLESRLDPFQFARISRSAIVNIERVREIRALWTGDFEVHLEDGKTILRMSRRYRERLLSQETQS
jgi:two-component system LytT family response regulator